METRDDFDDAVVEVHIVADWSERAEKRGWRVAEVIALDEFGNRASLRIKSVNKPFRLKKRQGRPPWTAM